MESTSSLAAYKSVHSVGLRSVGTNIVDISFKYCLGLYDNWTIQEREEFLAKLDPLEFLNDVKDVAAEVATFEAENHLLTAFLQKNDPRLLIGLKRKPASTSNRSRASMQSSKSITSSTYKRSQSVRSSLGNKKSQQYNLNSKAKADIVDMSALELEKCLMESEITVEQELKVSNAQVEELRRRTADNYQTEKNYILHFLSTQEEQPSAQNSPAALVLKFRKFTTHWLKTADVMLDNINLYISNLWDRCQNLRHDITIKSDMSKFATEIEFERMIIFRNGLLNITKDQLTQKNGLKTTANRTSYALTTLCKDFEKLRMKIKDVRAKITETNRQLEKLEEDINIIETSNAKDHLQLETMTKRFDTYLAPSIDEYMQNKIELSNLKKEETILARKIAILTMKLKTLQRKLNMRKRKHSK